MAHLNQAIALAAEAHDGQFDKGGAAYILHPLRVMAAMRSDQDRIVAVLHDVPEDCPLYPVSDLRKAFGDEVGDALDAITKRAGEQYHEYLDRVAANSIARRVKMADLADNIDLSRLGREPEEADYVRCAKYQKAAGYLYSKSTPSKG
jgi:(p)ppGpp synthase/HD superfamily hydrolase